MFVIVTKELTTHHHPYQPVEELVFDDIPAAANNLIGTPGQTTGWKRRSDEVLELLSVSHLIVSMFFSQIFMYYYS